MKRQERRIQGQEAEQGSQAPGGERDRQRVQGFHDKNVLQLQGRWLDNMVNVLNVSKLFTLNG